MHNNHLLSFLLIFICPSFFLFFLFAASFFLSLLFLLLTNFLFFTSGFTFTFTPFAKLLLLCSHCLFLLQAFFLNSTLSHWLVLFALLLAFSLSQSYLSSYAHLIHLVHFIIQNLFFFFNVRFFFKSAYLIIIIVTIIIFFFYDRFHHLKCP